MPASIYALIFAVLAIALVAALVLPAPARPADDEDGLQLALFGAGGAALIAMGVLALLDQPAQSTVCGAIAWLLVVPGLWLARAPRATGDWDWGDEDEDDDGGGSPPPRHPLAPPAPDDGLPGLHPPAVPAASSAWTAAAQPAPAVATASAPQPARFVSTAAKVQRLLAEQDAQRLAAEQDAQRLVAEQRQRLVAEHRQRLLDAQRLAAQRAERPVAPVEAEAQPGGVAPAVPAVPGRPAPPRRRPMPRVRADGPSVAHVAGDVAHPLSRRPAPGTTRRPAPPARD
ncbi:MAG TPA: hypothetical protein VG474_06245 [Solirubrobacteraceae bacterium]|nr:hypothetical protein [Solirubrobacteraceae bacterium]